MMDLQAGLNGPDRDRTCDLGIKSPARLAATSCGELKRAANRAVHRCNELQLIAACGDKPVRPTVRPRRWKSTHAVSTCQVSRERIDLSSGVGVMLDASRSGDVEAQGSETSRVSPCCPSRARR